MDALTKLKNILAASRTETDNYVSRETLTEAVEQMEAMQQDKADLLAQLKDARREVELLRELEWELRPLRRLRDALLEVLGLGCRVEATLPVSPEEMAGWTIVTVNSEETP
jgi:hypothetical protein